MTKRIMWHSAAAAVMIAAASAASAQRATAEADVTLGKIANQYICTFDSSVSPGNVRAETARAIGRSMGQTLHTYDTVLRGFAVRMPATTAGSAVAELRRNNPRIASCEQDQVMKAAAPPPGKGPGGGGSTPPAEEPDWGVLRVGGPGTAVSGRRAWILDTGIDLDHPDLNTAGQPHANFISRDSSPDDLNGHGTHVAGTIAAVDNEIGVIGVAPGAPVVAVRVLDRRGSGTTSGVIAGVEYVADNASSGDVANMSLTGGASLSLDNAVIAAASRGIRFTLAAGNNGANANNYSPARANGDNIYTVSAFSNGDNWASFSNFGNPPVDYGEPGVSIRSTYKNGGYTTLSGTSMAAPHLAGILMTNQFATDGVVNNDPDNVDDPIGVRVAPPE